MQYMHVKMYRYILQCILTTMWRSVGLRLFFLFETSRLGLFYFGFQPQSVYFIVFTAWCCSVCWLSAAVAASSRAAASLGPQSLPVCPRLWLSAKCSVSSDAVMSHCSRSDVAAPPCCPLPLFVLLHFSAVSAFIMLCVGLLQPTEI